MSSESTTYYLVQSNEEIDAAARLAALTAVRQCSLEYDELRAAAATFASRNADTGVTIALPDAPVATLADTSTRAGAEAYLEDWRRTINAARRLIDEGHSRAASRRFLRALGGGAGPRTAREIVQDVGNRQVAADTSRWLSDIERILADTRASAADMERLLQEAQGLRDLIGTGHGAGPAIESFRQRAAAVTAGYAARQREIAEAIQLQGSLAGMGGEEVDATLRELLEVQSGRSPLHAGLRDQVLRVARRARATADDRWVATLVEQELVRLGYQVEVGFSTASGEVTHLQARRRDWVERDGTATHDVQLEFDPRAEGKADGAIEITVRHAPDESLAAAQRNLAAESRWCDDFLVLLHRLKQHKVTLHIPRESFKRPQAATARGRKVLNEGSTARQRSSPAPRSRQRERP